jgi:hypothetical protein
LQELIARHPSDIVEVRHGYLFSSIFQRLQHLRRCGVRAVKQAEGTSASERGKDESLPEEHVVVGELGEDGLPRLVERVAIEDRVEEDDMEAAAAAIFFVGS